MHELTDDKISERYFFETQFCQNERTNKVLKLPSETWLAQRSAKIDLKDSADTENDWNYNFQHLHPQTADLISNKKGGHSALRGF